jgi:hypothetical protein
MFEMSVPMLREDLLHRMTRSPENRHPTKRKTDG